MYIYREREQKERKKEGKKIVHVSERETKRSTRTR